MVTNLSRENIFKNILTLLSGSAVSQVALALSVFLTAKVLGVELFGVYTSCFALTKISSILINLGVDNWLLREGSYHPEKAERFIGDIFSIKLIAGVGWFLLIFGLSFFLDRDIYPRGFLALVAVATWTDSILITCQSVFKLLLKNTITALLSSVSGIALLSITILFIFQGVAQPGPYVWARLIVTTITLVIAIAWVRKTVHLKLPHFINFEVIRGAFPFLISDGLYLLYMYADINLIALMLGEHEAGIYSPATSILSALYVVPQAIFTVMVPVLTFSITHRSGNSGAIIRRMNLGLFGLGLVMWAGTGLLGPQIIGVLGEQFAGTGEILRILSVILFFKCLSFGMAVVLTSVGWQKQRVKAQTVSAVVTILLNLYVIRAFGISGAAWVFVFGEAILLLGYAIPAAKWKQAVTQLKRPAEDDRQNHLTGQSSSTRVLIINLHSTRNAGDATLMDLAIAEARRAFPNCKITLAMNDPASYTGGIEVVSSVGKIVKTSRPGSTSSWSTARLAWFLLTSLFTVISKQLTGKTILLTRSQEERRLIEAYLRADLVISAPGNFLYSSGGFGIGMLITVYSMAYARLAGKPLYLLPQTIGPLTRKRDERLVRWILVRSRMIFIREEQSARQLQRIGIPPTRFHLVPDLAFTAPICPRSETDAILRQHGVDPQDRQPLLGVTLIDWGAQNRNFQHQERYEEAVYHAVRHFVDCHQGKAVFFAQVTGPTPADDDRIPAQRVARRLQSEGKAVAFVEEALSPAVLKSAYGSMDLFLGSRLHSTIFALSSGVPTIGIGYQPKTIGVFQMLGLEPWVFEIGDVDPERLSEKLDQLWQQRKDLAAVIKDRIAQVQAESTQVADRIAKDYAAYKAEMAR